MTAKTIEQYANLAQANHKDLETYLNEEADTIYKTNWGCSSGRDINIRIFEMSNGNRISRPAREQYGFKYEILAEETFNYLKSSNFLRVIHKKQKVGSGFSIEYYKHLVEARGRQSMHDYLLMFAKEIYTVNYSGRDYDRMLWVMDNSDAIHTNNGKFYVVKKDAFQEWKSRRNLLLPMKTVMKEEQETFSVTVKGFKTKEQANEFIDWYSGSGEQEFDTWVAHQDHIENFFAGFKSMTEIEDGNYNMIVKIL